MRQFKKGFKLTFLSLFIFITIISKPDLIYAQDITLTNSSTGIIQRGNYYAINSKGEKITHQDGYNFRVLYANGIPAFCIEPDVLVGNGIGYTISEFNHAEREIFSRIIYHGYDNNSKSNKDYVITQNVLWEFIESIREDLYIHKDWYLEGINYQLEKETLMNKVNSHNYLASFANDVVTINAGKEITLTDLNNIINDSAIISNGGLDVSINQNKLKINTTYGSPTSALITFKKYPHITADTAVSPILYSHPTSQKFITGGNPDPIPYKLNVNINHQGTLKIGKLNEDTNELVPHTTFEIAIDESFTNPFRVTTNSDGYTDEISLEKGTYYYREISVPVNLVLDETIRTIEIIPGQVEEVVVPNKVVVGKILIVKVEDNQVTPITGAIFSIKDNDDNLIETITTDENGFALSSELKYGNYFINEIFTPENYMVDKTTYPINISENDVTVIKYIANKKLEVRLKIEKKDIDTDEPLKGAIFEIVDEDDNLISFDYLNESGEIVTQTRLETNSQGIAYTSGVLKVGTYYLKEIKAPLGYLKMPPIKFEVNQETEIINLPIYGYTTTITLSNQATLTSILKLSTNTNLPLAGVHLRLVNNSTEEIISEWITAEEAVIFKSLNVDETYRLEEISGLDGYIKNEPLLFTIKESSEVLEILYYNELAPLVKTEIVSYKLDETLLTLNDLVSLKDLLPEKTYTLKGSIINKKTLKPLVIDNKEVTSTLSFNSKEINENQEVTFIFDTKYLTKGEYVIFEELYKDDKLIAFHKDINDMKQTITLTQVIINKKDDTTFKKLKGAKFEIYDTDNNLIDRLTSDKNGQAKIILPAGYYLIKETAPPDGYQNDLKDFNISITGQESNYEYILDITNKKIPSLPNTGVKMEVLTYGSLLLMSGVVILAISYKRKPEDKGDEK